MPVAAIKRITTRIRKLIAETEPPSSAPPVRANPSTHVAGRLCMQGAALLRKRLFRLLAEKHRLLSVNLSGVRFMDGCALAVLVEFAQACMARGTALQLIQPTRQVWNAFTLYGLREVLVEYADNTDPELEGTLIIVEEDFPDSIRLPALLVVEDDFPDSIRLPAAA
ncbi:MAG: STAS domain-containing protein [Planctomycetes bacterium]|nr:STAS domain-containing protein [Planctomycetota bacterium]